MSYHLLHSLIWFDAGDVPDHSPIPVLFCRYCALPHSGLRIRTSWFDVAKCRFLVLFHCGACRRESAHQPDDFNGYGYFYVRVYCTCLGFQANIVEEYVLLSALQHIFAGLKRTRDQKLSSGLMSGQLSRLSLVDVAHVLDRTPLPVPLRRF